MIDKIKRHLSRLNLDIRKKWNPRPIDQKITPDVVMAVSDVILHYESESFTVGDLWRSPRFDEIVSGEFSKPRAMDSKTAREYDKFLGQPINFLIRAGVLKEVDKRGGARLFCVAERRWLDFLASGESNAVEFLSLYLTKVMESSGIGDIFDNFYRSPSKQNYQEARDAFRNLLHDHTPINGEREVGRIFMKVFNIPAFKHKTAGSIGGDFSVRRIRLHDIRYNRPNWRDTRSSGRNLRKTPSALNQPDKSYRAEKAMSDVKNHHGKLPEIQDSTTNPEVGVEAHHIFTQSEYPRLANFRENIILLTPDQHKGFAHVKGRTGKISLAYQNYCLQTKLRSIEECEIDDKCAFYSIALFAQMLVAGGVIGKKEEKSLDFGDSNPNLPLADRKDLITKSANDLRRLLAEYYTGKARRS